MDSLKYAFFVKTYLAKLGRARWTLYLLAVIALSMFVHIFFLIAGWTFLRDWRWEHHPVHASVEIGGALIAGLVAATLVMFQRRGRGTSFNVWIAGALIGMGLLDGFHALVHVGKTFVWLHSCATLIGGSLFALVWLGPAAARRVARFWHWAVLAVVVVFGSLSLLFADLIPTMVREGEFTLVAKMLNVVGGIMLIAAAVKMVLVFLRTRIVDDVLFCLHCSLFGAAAIMFEQSQLWDAPWWGWHLLRFLAYGLALWFVCRSVLNVLRELTDSKEKNERLVNNLFGAFLYRHDKDGVFNYVSPSVTQVLGYSTDAFPAHFAEYLTDHPVNQEVVKHTEQSAKGNQQPPYELQIYHKDGSARWLDVSETPVRDGSGKVVAVEGIAHDITERKRAEEELEHHREHLEELVTERTTELDKRTAELQKVVNLMAHREVRMAELKETMKNLREQIEEAGMTRVADDPLMKGRSENVEG